MVQQIRETGEIEVFPNTGGRKVRLKILKALYTYAHWIIHNCSTLSEGDVHVSVLVLVELGMPTADQGDAATTQGTELRSSCYSETDLVTDESASIVSDNVIFYLAGCLVKEFLSQKSDSCACERFLKAEDCDVLAGPHQFLTMLKENNVPGELFGSVTVPSEACFECVQEMEKLFLDNIGAVAHLPNVCQILCTTLTASTDLFCTFDCHTKFVKMFALKRIKWHIRFINRTLKLHRSRHSAADRKMRKVSSARGTASDAARPAADTASASAHSA